MTAHQIHNVLNYVGYGVWNVANITMVWVIRSVGIPLKISTEKEIIAWWTTEVVTVLTGLSVIVALALGIRKLIEWIFPPKKSEIRPFKKRK